jgi:hypothetical protein
MYHAGDFFEVCSSCTLDLVNHEDAGFAQAPHLYLPAGSGEQVDTEGLAESCCTFWKP